MENLKKKLYLGITKIPRKVAGIYQNLFVPSLTTKHTAQLLEEKNCLRLQVISHENERRLLSKICVVCVIVSSHTYQ